MADFKFACTKCGQEIECDELWSGHQIQCPTCQAEITVPPKPEAAPHADLASAKPGQPRLSIGQSRDQRSAAPPPPPPQMETLQHQLNQAKLAKKGSAMKWVTISVVVIVLGVGGYFGYGYYIDWQAKREEAAKQASAEAAKQAAAAAAAAAAASGAPATPAPEKQLPLIPAVWTLDADKIVIPNGKVNGVVSGTNFIPDIARLDKVGPTYLLRLLQGAPASPDYGFMVYLKVNAGESVTGRTWTVTQDLKDKNLPQVVKLWKTNPRYAAKQKAFSSGYAMKLELGQVENGMIPGKIFIAVPDTEQSVIAGVFRASTSLGDPNGAVAATPAAVPNPRMAPAAAPAPAFDKRYGKKR